MEYSKKQSRKLVLILLILTSFLAWRAYQVSLNLSISTIENKIITYDLKVEELHRAPYKWNDQLPWKSTGFKDRVVVDSIEDLIDYADNVGVRTIHRSGSDFYVFCTARMPRIYHGHQLFGGLLIL